MRDLIKAIALIKRRPDISREQFAKHYEDVHAPLALRYFRDWRGYIRNHVVGALRGGEPAFDCISEFWFSDLQGVKDTVEFTASAAAQPLRVEGRYDAASYELEESYETYGETGWVYRLSFGRPSRGHEKRQAQREAQGQQTSDHTPRRPFHPHRPPPCPQYNRDRRGCQQGVDWVVGWLVGEGNLTSVGTEL